ncbi:pseudouridylate synthase [Algoriphagus aestuariicola]|jgi:tRNA pseudouridine65 synthase|uniref:tRNA pseudouridine synthase C n=1 Tax=Algoriphagus aestuariicola TaxID=1852016 RepID=A0ABS3BMH4_9BACT|nr:pseudouridine synthase [Algoriphagus aestuariicola]MBN7800499.1 pseudouridylate synthase [Algoriphagus aestuariicola]
MLEILFEDENLILIDKPAGLLVHKTRQAYGEEENALIQLRDQIGSWVAPVHRLDRATSGVLLFAKNEEILPALKAKFMDREVQKTYLTISRGIPQEKESLIDHPLTSERSNKAQEAQTRYRVLAETEIPYNSTGRYPTSRYSLLEVDLLTGRTHQIRRHLAHIRHYIIGDKKHGDNKQNIFFECQFGLQNLLLHAWKLSFRHPLDGQEISLSCPIPAHFRTIMQELGWAHIKL